VLSLIGKKRKDKKKRQAYALLKETKRNQPIPVASSTFIIKEKEVAPEAMIKCNYCGTLMKATETKCPNCGAIRKA
jgi:rubrerythrin